MPRGHLSVDYRLIVLYAMRPWSVLQPRGCDMPTRINRTQSRDDGNRQSRPAHDEPGSSTPGVHRIGSARRDPPTATHCCAAARHAAARTGDPSSDPSTASVFVLCNENGRRAAYAARLSVGGSSHGRAPNTAGDGVRRRENHSDRANLDGVCRSVNHSNTGDGCRV